MRVRAITMSAATLALAAVALGGGGGDAGALVPSTRVAIVIGNAAYSSSPLPNPRNDARAVTGTLRELGFEVHTFEDATRPAMKQLLQELPTMVEPGDLALFYYAGHAVQFRGVNYLLPVDFAIERADELPKQSLVLDELLNAMGEAGVSVVVLDACRDYPFGPLHEAFGDGLAGVATKGETLVAYSTAAGDTALDGTGPNSPYTAAFVAALELPGRDLYDVFRTVRGKVREATGGRQIPWISGSLESRLVLREEEQAAQPEVQAAIATAEASGDPTADIAASYWTTIAQSADPADFAQFKAAYPQSPLAQLASLRQSELLAEGQTPVAALEVGDEIIRGPGGKTLKVTACDRWAADPDDATHVAPGVYRSLINTRQAIRACASAVAADPGNLRLLYQFGRALDSAERFDEAVRAYQQAAEAGYAPAMTQLAYLYRSGRVPEPGQDVAANLYFTAAELGHAGARAALGQMYKYGWGVPQSPAETARWVGLAAETGYAPAMDALATMYRDGLGVPVDLRKAFELHRAAASQGHSNAMNNLGQIYRDGRGVDKDIAEAVRWFTEATELGNPLAPYHLSKIYLDGAPGIPPDPARAEALLKLAVDRGHDYALVRLAGFYEGGKGRKPDYERTAYYLLLAQEVGKAVNHPVAEKMGAQAADKLKTIQAKLPPAELDRARGEVADWISQNGLESFQLLYHY